MRRMIQEALEAAVIIICIVAALAWAEDTFAKDNKAAWKLHAAKMEHEKGLPVGLLQAVCEQESHWRNVNGKDGEIGVCQVKPGTVRMICPKCPNKIAAVLEDPHMNIRWAANYLVWLRENVSPDPAIMMAAYNGGPAHPVVRYMLQVQRRMLAHNANL